MYRIAYKKDLNEQVTLMKIEAPLIAKKARPGQFIIFRIDEYGERVPLTIADTDPEAGTVTIIFQKVGLSTNLLGSMNAGDSILDFVGPLGAATDLDGIKMAAVIGGGVGCAIALPIARELHEQGYAVFSLRYRIGWEAGDDAPLEDLARAIRFVMDNADTFGVSTEDYALLGYSSGGQLAGVFGNEEKGWGRYGVPKPGVLLLAYPINNFFEAKPAYHLLMDTDRLERRYYSYTVSKLVTPDYPPTFLWYGRNDLMLKAFVYPLQGPTLAKALEASGVPNRVEVYDNAKHGIGIGVGTDAEDWVERAAEFWQSVSE